MDAPKKSIDVYAIGWREALAWLSEGGNNSEAAELRILVNQDTSISDEVKHARLKDIADVLEKIEDKADLDLLSHIRKGQLETLARLKAIKDGVVSTIPTSILPPTK